MSVLIKGLKIPEKGLVEIIISPDGKAYVLARPLIDTEHAEVSETYDASELPNHGRLVDADDFISESKCGNYWWETEEQVPQILNEMPTIIPAERSEDE